MAEKVSVSFLPLAERTMAVKVPVASVTPVIDELLLLPVNTALAVPALLVIDSTMPDPTTGALLLFLMIT